MNDASSINRELRLAVHDLNARGLSQASRWAAEQLVGLNYSPPAEEMGDLHGGGYTPSAASTSAAHGGGKTAATDDPLYLLGKSYFDDKEYQRSAHLLREAQGGPAQFMRLYSVFLAGEQIREQERVQAGGSLGKAEGANPALSDLESFLEPLMKGDGDGHGDPGASDPFLMYLYGVVLLERKKTQKAQGYLIGSLKLYPCNWSAWQALRPLCTSLAALEGLVLPNHWSRDFFLAGALLELQQNQEALGRLHRLAHVFPTSPMVECLVAQAHYHLQNYDEAQSLFEDILGKDPFRLEGIEIFSNILFVKEQFVALSQLAQRAMNTNRFRPETCCVVGNYYSLRGQHEGAVESFRRALRLDPSCLAAWTLMGHEYMELKNTSAAIEAYRRAVDLHSHDFRAWYGLGQAYELLKMPYYALYYYRRAAALRPEDPRMWCALGQCFMSDQVDLQDQAIRCFRRALEYEDPEGIAAHTLARLYESRGDHDAAEVVYSHHLAGLDAAGQPLGSDSVEALLFLAAHYKDKGRLAESRACCERLLDIGGPAKERAKAIAREVHALMQRQAAADATAAAAREHRQHPRHDWQRQGQHHLPYQHPPSQRSPYEMGTPMGGNPGDGGGGGTQLSFGQEGEDDDMDASGLSPE